MKKDSREVRRLRNGAVVVEAVWWDPMLACFCVGGCLRCVLHLSASVYAPSMCVRVLAFSSTQFNLSLYICSSNKIWNSTQVVHSILVMLIIFPWPIAVPSVLLQYLPCTESVDISLVLWTQLSYTCYDWRWENEDRWVNGGKCSAKPAWLPLAVAMLRYQHALPGWWKLSVSQWPFLLHGRESVGVLWQYEEARLNLSIPQIPLNCVGKTPQAAIFESQVASLAKSVEGKGQLEFSVLTAEQSFAFLFW